MSQILSKIRPVIVPIYMTTDNQVTFRKKIYEDIDQLQNDLDLWIDHYNNERTHQGKVCEGRTPMQTLEDGKEIWKEKFVD